VAESSRDKIGTHNWPEISGVLITGRGISVTLKPDNEVQIDDKRNPRWTIPAAIPLPTGIIAKRPLRPGMKILLQADPMGTPTWARVWDPETRQLETLREPQPRQLSGAAALIRTINGASRGGTPTAPMGPQHQLAALLQYDPPSYQTLVTQIRYISGNSKGRRKNFIEIYAGDEIHRHPEGELVRTPNVGDRMMVWKQKNDTTEDTRGVAYGEIAWYLDPETYSRALGDDSPYVGEEILEFVGRNGIQPGKYELERAEFGNGLF
jgi:hypothetical protein